MEIRKSKEILVLTQIEKAILLKTQEILNEIFNESENEGDMEYYSRGAKTGIYNLLENAEVENGEPKGAINVTIIM